MQDLKKKKEKNHTLLDQFYMNLIPYSLHTLYTRYTHTVLDCEKVPSLREFLDEPDTASWHSSAPTPPGQKYSRYKHVEMLYWMSAFVFNCKLGYSIKNLYTPCWR